MLFELFEGGGNDTPVLGDAVELLLDTVTVDSLAPAEVEVELELVDAPGFTNRASSMIGPFTTITATLFDPEYEPGPDPLHA